MRLSWRGRPRADTIIPVLLRSRMIWLASAFLAACGPLAAQCAMCGESIANAKKEGGADPALAFSLGVIVLLGVLFSLAGGLVLMIFKASGEPTSQASATTPSRR